ncbi:MAG: alpha/beta fold hydrolase [Robiginitomaculum sp.]|nr:alpha/beta fold hydrolase [Robiginitomaculum sp.]
MDHPSTMSSLVGLSKEEMITAIGGLLRSTLSSPMITARHIGNLGKETIKIVRGQSELEPHPKDRRFKDPVWKSNPFYRAGLQYWMAWGNSVDEWAADLRMGELERARARFILGMVTDALAPTNTLIGNPAAMKQAYATGGASLLRGLKNAYTDITTNGGMPSQVDTRPFEVGKNLATSKGAVVFRNELLELIQYQPTTPDVHKVPLLQIPPQINKFYVADLTPDKSIVQYLLSQGIQLFVISWRNPTRQHSGWGLAQYVEAIEEASSAAMKITRQKKINITAACSGGITASCFVSAMEAKKDKRVNSFTLQVCVLDPNPRDSEVGVFVSERGIEIARKASKRKGILEGDELAKVFAWLRPNDLIWNYVVNNYLLGEDPPPYDVLFWNNDTTNLPAALHSDYLDIYHVKPFVTEGGVDFAGHNLDMKQVKQDLFIVAGTTDHITPWKACYRTTDMMGSDNITFVLSNSGHIQSLINPPGNPKASYFTADKMPENADEWLAGAEQQAGSWWPEWGKWLTERSGESKKAPVKLGNKAYPPLLEAPGSYVFE